jgi:hypothetical protein
LAAAVLRELSPVKIMVKEASTADAEPSDPESQEAAGKAAHSSA